MALRSGQEQKFKNIVIQADSIKNQQRDPADIYPSNFNKSASSPHNHSPKLPSTPINIYKYLSNEAPPQSNFAFSQLQGRPIEESRSQETEYEGDLSNYKKENRGYSSMLIKNASQENPLNLIVRLQAEIHEKEEIIMELKNIIRISNENNARGKIKAVYIGEKSPEKSAEEQEKQLKELRHNVKILTIQNNSLSDYIDKLKSSLEARQAELMEHQRSKGEDCLEDYQKEINRLNELIKKQQRENQTKLDQFISSHKSLAYECQVLEQEKVKLQQENERLILKLRDSEESYSKLSLSLEERLTKSNSSQKYSIQKIKQQYGESLKQFKQTVGFETEHLFDQFRAHFQSLTKKIAFLENKITKAEAFIIQIKGSDSKRSRMSKKSEIYIEEGVDSSVGSSSRKKAKDNLNQRPFVISRIYEDSATSKENSEESTRPLKQEILRLKDIVNELQRQMSQRSNSYTFREKQYENSVSQLQTLRNKCTIQDQELVEIKRQMQIKEKQLFEQVERHRSEINKLEMAYKRERNALYQSFNAEVQKKQSIIVEVKAQLSNIRVKYDQSVQELKHYASSSRLQAELQRENQRLKKQLAECISKVEQYKKLCILMKEQIDQRSDYESIINDMKSQICVVRQKYHNDLAKLSQLSKEKEELEIVNRQIKVKMELALDSSNRSYETEQRLKVALTNLEKEKEEFCSKVSYLSSTIKILEKQVREKGEVQRSLMEEKKNLEKQIVGYLGLFRKRSLEETKRESKQAEKSLCIHQQFGLQQLLNQVSRLQVSFSEEKSSRRQKREKLAQVLSQALGQYQLSQLRRL